VLFRQQQAYNQVRKMTNYLLSILFKVVVKEPHPKLLPFHLSIVNLFI